MNQPRLWKPAGSDEVFLVTRRAQSLAKLDLLHITRREVPGFSEALASKEVAFSGQDHAGEMICVSQAVDHPVWQWAEMMAGHYAMQIPDELLEGRLARLPSAEEKRAVRLGVVFLNLRRQVEQVFGQ